MTKQTKYEIMQVVETLTLPAKIDKKKFAPKYIPLKDILDNLSLTHGNIRKTAKIVGCSYQALYQRLNRLNINFEEYQDFKENKDASYEMLQARLINDIDALQIQKTPVGSKVLAVCQLEDKIRLLRGQATSLNVSVSLTQEQSARYAGIVDDIVKFEVQEVLKGEDGVAPATPEELENGVIEPETGSNSGSDMGLKGDNEPK